MNRSEDTSIPLALASLERTLAREARKTRITIVSLFILSALAILYFFQPQLAVTIVLVVGGLFLAVVIAASIGGIFGISIAKLIGTASERRAISKWKKSA